MVEVVKVVEVRVVVVMVVVVEGHGGGGPGGGVAVVTGGDHGQQWALSGNQLYSAAVAGNEISGVREQARAQAGVF